MLSKEEVEEAAEGVEGGGSAITNPLADDPVEEGARGTA